MTDKPPGPLQPYESGSYHTVYLKEDSKRDVLWNSLWKFYFVKQIRPDDCVLDLGSGFGNFINSVTARRRIAIDAWPGYMHHLAQGVEGIVGPVKNLNFLDNASVDFAFASNLFEHLTQEDLSQLLSSLLPKLSSKGTLTMVQPNYRYAYKEYFDDYTHLTVYSHISLKNFLLANGYEIMQVKPRFLPLTLKSRLPVFPFLIALYLALPIKPMGKQMLIKVRPCKESN